MDHNGEPRRTIQHWNWCDIFT